MAVACQVIMSAVEKAAPRYLAEDWDNVGLLIGEPSRPVSKVLMTLDCTKEVVQEALQNKVELILAHHPLIFSPLKQVRFDLPGQDLVAELIRHDIMFYAAHTNLDSCGLSGNALIADHLGLTEQEFLAPGYRETMFKVAVFTPVAYVQRVREAMVKAGGGGIGNYTECFFQSQGTGTFRPLEGAHPFIGKIGILEQVEEVKLETIVPSRSLERVIRAMLKAHPYEVPAYDVIPTQNPGSAFGIGKIGRLPYERTLSELAQDIKKLLGNCPLRIAGDQNKLINKVAICTGSGGSMVKKATFKGAGVLIAGDISHHEALDALAAGMAIIDPGHYATEWPMVEHFAKYLQAVLAEGKRDVQILLSQIKTEPFKFLNKKI